MTTPISGVAFGSEPESAAIVIVKVFELGERVPQVTVTVKV